MGINRNFRAVLSVRDYQIQKYNTSNFKLPNITTFANNLVVRVPGYRSRGPGSIPGATRFSEK
jgi:hypothetical protein